MKKRGISLLLAMLLILSASSLCYAVKFDDVGSAFSWAQEAIEELSEDEVVSGYPDGTFKPGADITKEEAVALFAKALGFNDKSNDGILNASKEAYAASLESYTSYAVEQAAFLLYKNVLKDDEITKFMSKANKGQPLKRYEAAMMIGRAIGADKWIKTNPDFDLSFADASDIPASATAYVYYVSDAEIMNGMDDNKFMPEGNVTRAQIAVIINRIRKNYKFTYESGVISELDSAFDTITLKYKNGKTESYNLNKNVFVNINGKAAQTTLLEIGMDVVITKSNEMIYALDAFKTIPDESISGVFKGKQTDSTSTTIKIADVDTSKVEQYILAQDAVITYNGMKATLSEYSTNDFVRAEVKGGEIAVLDGEPRNVTLEGLIVESIEFSPDVTIKLRDTDNEITSYTLQDRAKLKRNGSEKDFSELSVGDTVNITLEYGTISSIVAYGVDKTVTGEIEEITISKSASYLTVNTGNQSVKYALGRDVKITVDGAEGTMYDLRLGDEAQFSVSSSTVNEITVKSVATATQISGIVTLVNSAYGMIVVDTVDNKGNTKEQQVFVKSTAKILDAGDGKVKAVKDIKAGQNIMAAGVVNTGIFEATSIMILAK